MVKRFTPDIERQQHYRELYEQYVASRLGTPDARTDGESPDEARAQETSVTPPNRILPAITWLPGDPGEGDYFGRSEWANERQAMLSSWKRESRARRALSHPLDETAPLAA